MEKHAILHSTQKKFSILIPTWNNLNFLKLCVNSLRKNSHFSHQIIIHVNEGNDGSLAWIKEQKDLDYTWSKDNIGICYALNYARTLSVCDYIVYMNDDMYVCPNWDLAIWNAIEKQPNHLFFFSSRLIEPQPYLKSSIQGDFGNKEENFREEELLSSYKNFIGKDYSGALYPLNIVHKDVWDCVGGYSIEFSPGYGSDPDFVAKLWRFGIREYRILGECLVYHFGKISTSKIRKDVSKSIFLLKWKMTFRDLRNYFLHFDTLEPIREDVKLGYKRKLINAVKTCIACLKTLFSKNI